MGIGFRETLITLQSFEPQLPDNLIDQFLVEIPGTKFALQFLRAVFTPCQKGECPFPYGMAIIAQASASSASSVFAVTTRAGNAFSRIAVSISAATSGFSCRNALTLSLP